MFNLSVGLKSLFAQAFGSLRTFDSAYITGPAVDASWGRKSSRFVENWITTIDATAANVTLTVLQFLSGFWHRNIGATIRTDTTPTAAAIIAAMSRNPRVGDTVFFTIYNAGSVTLTLAGGTGVTILGGNTIAATTGATYAFVITSVASNTANLIRV